MVGKATQAAPKAAASTNVSTNTKDTGSASYQTTALTMRIKELTGHLKIHKKDFAARRGLLQMVGQRRRLEKYALKKGTSVTLTPPKKAPIAAAKAAKKKSA